MEEKSEYEPLKIMAPFQIDTIKIPLASTTRVTLPNGAVTRPKSSDNEKHYLCAVDDEDFIYPVTHKDFYDGIIDGTIRLQHRYFSAQETLKRERNGVRRMQDLRPKQLARVAYTERMCLNMKELLDSTAIKITGAMKKALLKKWHKTYVQELVDKATDEELGGNAQGQIEITVPKRAFCTKTFDKHWKTYLESDGDVILFARKATRKGLKRNKGHYSPKTLAFAMQWADLAHDPTNRKPKPLWKRYCRAVAKIQKETSPLDFGFVPFSKFADLIDAAKTAYERMLSKDGPAKARAEFRPQRHGMDIMRPGEVIQFDSKLIDLNVWFAYYGFWDRLTVFQQKAIENKRVWITIAVDVSSGYVPGLIMSAKETTRMVIDCIEMTLSDKSHIAEAAGARMQWFLLPMEIFQSDNGPVLNNQEIMKVAEDARFGLEHTPAEQSWLRGTVESTLREIGRIGVFGMPGQTFSSIAEKGDHDPEETAALLADEFYHFLVRMLLDFKHLQISGSRKDSSHNGVAKFLSEMRDDRASVKDVHELRHIFGVRFRRKIEPDGIMLWGIRYNNDALQRLRQKVGEEVHVWVSSSRRDIRWISVEIDTGEWITVPNRAGMREPVGMLEWIEMRRRLDKAAIIAHRPYEEIVWDALEEGRRLGEAAVLQAGLTMHPPTDDELRHHHEIMFEGKILDLDEKRPLRPLPVPSVHRDHLLEGRIELTQMLEEEREEKEKRKRKRKDARETPSIEHGNTPNQTITPDQTKIIEDDYENY